MTSVASAGATQPALELRSLRHVYGDGDDAHVAIDEVSFSVQPRRLVAIVGPSGCGKTTLLRTIAGLLSPTAGELLLEGTPITGVPPALAVVFQDYSRSLFPWMKVGANVRFPLTRLALKDDERRTRVQESLAAVGLEAAADRYPWQLSGGMQQRVALARALAYRPRLLLMDEPFASVDAQTRADLEDLVSAVHATFETTILFITHDMDEAVYLGDEVLVLAPAPTRVIAQISIDLPRPRDQISTKEDERFIRLRGEVARLIRRPRGPVEAVPTPGG